MKRALLVLVLFAVPARADQLFLKGGGVVSGVIVERTERAVTMEVAPGRITIPVSRIERVVEGSSGLSLYRERASKLAPADVAGWLALARWAEGQSLETEARECFEQVLAADPNNEAAHRALGDVLYAGRWTTAEESYRAQGLVLFEGEWVTPAERAALLREGAQADTARAEADARAAEARAREAEAEAAQAQASASQGDSAGLPLAWALYGGGPCTSCRPRAHPPRSRTPSPSPRTPPQRQGHSSSLS